MSRDHEGGLDRRRTLKCTLWAGTGVVWTVAGGVPASRLIGSAKAGTSGFSFVQISDSHIGFEKPANPDARATLNAAIDKIAAMPGTPAFMIHTGDRWKAPSRSTPPVQLRFRSQRQERRLRRGPSSCPRANCANGLAFARSSTRPPPPTLRSPIPILPELLR